MLASAGGFGVGSVLGLLVAGQGGPWPFGPSGDLIYTVVAAAFAGIMQWLVLRRKVSWAGLWAAVSPVGYGLFVAIGPMLGPGAASPPGPIGVVLVGSMISAGVGVLLVRLLRRAQE